MFQENQLFKTKTNNNYIQTYRNLQAMLQSIDLDKLGQKIRNPFSLLEDENASPQIHLPIVQRQKQYKPIKKIGSMPFAKYEIKHEIKQLNTQTKIKKESKERQAQRQQNRQQKHLNVAAQQNKQKTTNSLQQKDSFQKQSEREPNIANNEESISVSQYTEDDEDRKYFLTKKHRQIKYELNADGDPPLFYDIGLDPEMIKDKLKLVLKMGEPDYDMIMNPDLAGPVLIAFSFGFLLLFSGQIHFGDIYALFIIGNLLLFTLFNFMARKGVISLYNIMSILGYSLLPMLTLGFVGIFYRLNTGFGLFFCLLVSLWSSMAGGNFIQALVKGKKNMKALIVYPLFLFYASFAMIVIF